MFQKNSNYVIHSKNEEKASMDGAGFWSNTLGWTTLDQATHFSKEDTETLNLPNATGYDAKWVSINEAEKTDQGTISLRLTFDVSYSMNGVDVTKVLELLRGICDRAVSEGMLTGETDAEVEDYSINAYVKPEDLPENELVDFMLQRIEDGDLALEDIPSRLARYGMMEPNVFVDEMRERMESQNQ